MASPEMKDGHPHGSDRQYDPHDLPILRDGTPAPSTAQHGDRDLDHLMSEARSRARSTGRWSEAEITRTMGGGSTPASYDAYDEALVAMMAKNDASAASATGTGSGADSIAGPGAMQSDASNPLGERSAEETTHRTIAGAPDDELAPSDAAGTVKPENAPRPAREDTNDLMKQLAHMKMVLTKQAALLESFQRERRRSMVDYGKLRSSNSLVTPPYLV